MKRPTFNLLLSRIFLLLALLSLFIALVSAVVWRTTVPAELVPRTIVPFSDLRRFQRMAEELRPERLRSGDRITLEYSAEDLQKVATLLANGHPKTAQTQFEVAIAPLAVTVQAWWPTGVKERFLPVRIHWHPEWPTSLQRLYLGNWRMPSWLVTLINGRLDASAGGEQLRAIWRQYSPVIELHEQRLTLELEFQRGAFWPGSDQG